MFKMKTFYNLFFSFSMIVFPTFPQLKTNSCKNVCLQPGLLPWGPLTSRCPQPRSTSPAVYSSNAVCSTQQPLSAHTAVIHSLGLLPCLLYLAVCPNILIKNVKMSSVCLFQHFAFGLGLLHLFLPTAKAYCPSICPSVCPSISQHVLTCTASSCLSGWCRKWSRDTYKAEMVQAVTTWLVSRQQRWDVDCRHLVCPWEMVVYYPWCATG